jgi:hypothetical protein
MDEIKVLFILVFLGFAVWFGMSMFHEMSTMSAITDNVTDNLTTTASSLPAATTSTANLAATALPVNDKAGNSDNATDNSTAMSALPASGEILPDASILANIVKILLWGLCIAAGIAVLPTIIVSIIEGVSHAGGNTEARLHIPDETFILPQGGGNPGVRSHIDNQVFTVPHNSGKLTVKIISVEKPTETTSRTRNRRLKNT